MQKTTFVKHEEALKDKKWYIIDATNLILGRLAVEIANLLRGKNKPNFTPNVDCGDNVIVINSDKIALSSNKAEKEIWYSHSGYIGGLKKKSGSLMISKHSDKLIRNAVLGMLPKNNLSRSLIKKLYINKKSEHDKHAQKPIEYNISN